MEKIINTNSKKGYLSLIGLLVAAAIVCILAFSAFKLYFQKPAIDILPEKFVQEQNINTTNYQSILSSTKDELKKAIQAESEHANELEAMR